MKPNEYLKRLIKLRTAYAIVLLLSVGFASCDPMDVDILEDDGFKGLLPRDRRQSEKKTTRLPGPALSLGIPHRRGLALPKV